MPQVFLVIVSLSLGALGLAACGAPAPAPERAPAAAEVQPAAEQPRQAPAQDDRLWYVYWRGVHSLTVYPAPGAIRSRIPDRANATFRSTSRHFSIISTYFEAEDNWVGAIQAAQSVDDLLERIGAMAEVEIEADTVPLRDYSW